MKPLTADGRARRQREAELTGWRGEDGASIRAGERPARATPFYGYSGWLNSSGFYRSVEPADDAPWPLVSGIFCVIFAAVAAAFTWFLPVRLAVQLFFTLGGTLGSMVPGTVNLVAARANRAWHERYPDVDPTSCRRPYPVPRPRRTDAINVLRLAVAVLGLVCVGLLGSITVFQRSGAQADEPATSTIVVVAVIEAMFAIVVLGAIHHVYLTRQQRRREQGVLAAIRSGKPVRPRPPRSSFGGWLQLAVFVVIAAALATLAVHTSSQPLLDQTDLHARSLRVDHTALAVMTVLVLLGFAALEIRALVKLRRSSTRPPSVARPGRQEDTR